MGNGSFVLGVDLDGVVADFYGGLRPIAAEWLGVEVDTLTPNPTWGFPEWGLNEKAYFQLQRHAVTQRELFSSLRPIDGAPVILRKLSREHDVRIRIITHRLYIKYFHQIEARQTIEWLDKYDVPYWDLCFMKDKTAVGADLYIEDGPFNIKELQADGLPVIILSNSTNLAVPGQRANTWAEAYELILPYLDKWRGQHSEATSA